VDIVLQELEEKKIKRLSFILSFYIRYVDVILLAAPSEKFDEITNTFNFFHQHFQFILEVGEDDRQNFLYIVILDNRRILFDLFKKP